MRNVIIILSIYLLLSSNIESKEIYATFTVHAKQTAKLSFNYSGIVKSIDVDIMSKVAQNDVLATLVSDDLIATNKLSKVALKYAKLDYQRHEKLLKKNLIDKAQLDKYGLALESITAKIELENTILEKTILRAPFAGIITERMIEIGDVVSAQRLSTAYIMQSERMRILVVEFDQKYNNDVKIGDVFVYHIDGDEMKYEGTVYRIYPTANVNTRKIAVQVVANDLKVGLFGEGYIVTSEIDDLNVTSNEPSSE